MNIYESDKPTEVEIRFDAYIKSTLSKGLAKSVEQLKRVAANETKCSGFCNRR